MQCPNCDAAHDLHEECPSKQIDAEEGTEILESHQPSAASLIPTETGTEAAAERAESLNDDATSSASTTSTSATSVDHDASDIEPDKALDVVTTPITPTSASEERNQAPGIPDRRKSTRPSTAIRSPSSGSLPRSRRGGKAGGPPIRITMADISSDLKGKNGEESGDVLDEFEDASERTPQPTPKVEEQSVANGHVEAAEEKHEAPGLGITGDEVADVSKSTSQTTSDVSVVNGADPVKSNVAHSRQNTMETAPTLAPHPHRRDRSISPGRIPVRPSSPAKPLHGLSGDLPNPLMPPPSTAHRVQALEQRHLGERPNGSSPPPVGGGLAKKASSGLTGLLGRMGSIRKARSPPGRTESRLARRDTAASVASIDSNATGLASIADGLEGADAAKKPSLKDQFQSLRKQEELSMSDGSGHVMNGGIERTSMERTQSEIDVSSPTKAEAESERRLSRAASTPGPLKSPSLDLKLPPGTASGMAAGPAEEPRPVDWDLWQSVVYEGPAVVARTSGDELKRAIASGIPPAIRGVVWQVLADSMSEELEAIYRTLKARGTDAESQALKPQPMSRSESQSALPGAEKLSEVSSQSSVHSQEQDTSTTIASAIASPPHSLDGNPMDAHATLVAEKQKRDLAAVSKLEKAIKRDLGSRTSYSKYTQSAGLQDGLFGVCKAYALFDEGVGYAQGMNFIAMPLLFNMSEEEAFTLLVRLMSKYDVRSLFTADMAGLHLRLYQFERLLEDYEPALYCHLGRRNVGPQLYATQWFLTLFAYRFPLQLVLRIYDLVFSEGLTAILKFGIVLMQRNKEALLEMKDMGHLTTFLKEKVFDVYIDNSPSATSLLDSGFFGSIMGGADKELYRADEMVRDACDINIDQETLARYTAEWEELQKLEHSRTEELETLRAANTALNLRIKAVEERTQAQDTEHVHIASDLIKVKLENDALHDENEGLKMNVEQLQKLVNAQPAEVEGKLKEEMERIMRRNIEVQNENRGLREEMDEMERALVESKMGHAQVSPLLLFLRCAVVVLKECG